MIAPDDRGLVDLRMAALAAVLREMTFALIFVPGIND